jgi:hypothetical protein
MLIATFGPTTAWFGRAIAYDSGVFLLEGHGPISAGEVMRYDEQGHLVWASDWTRDWVTKQAEPAGHPDVGGNAARSWGPPSPGASTIGQEAACVVGADLALAQRRTRRAQRILAGNAWCAVALGILAFLAMMVEGDVVRRFAIGTALLFLLPGTAVLSAHPVRLAAVRRWLKSTAPGDFVWALVFGCLAVDGFLDWSFDNRSFVLAYAFFAAAFAGFGVLAVWVVLATPRHPTLGGGPERRHGGRSLRVLAACVGVAVLVAAVALIPTGHGNTVHRGIWAGYRATGQQFESVSATWVQPETRASWFGERQVAIWVGLDGGARGSHTVEQIGVRYADGIDPDTLRAWYEMYPAPPVTIDKARTASGLKDMAVRPGDTLTATVVSLGHQSFRLTIVDETRGESFSVIDASPAAKCDSAEIIVERTLEDGWGLPEFAPVHFTQCAVDDRPLSSFHCYSTEIRGHDGMPMTSTSTIDAGGISFSVARR